MWGHQIENIQLQMCYGSHLYLHSISYIDTSKVRGEQLNGTMGMQYLMHILMNICFLDAVIVLCPLVTVCLHAPHNQEWRTTDTTARCSRNPITNHLVWLNEKYFGNCVHLPVNIVPGSRLLINSTRAVQKICPEDVIYCSVVGLRPPRSGAC